MTRSFWLPPAVAVAAGLVLLLAGAAAWVAGEEIRHIGDIAVVEPNTVPGTEFAPLTVVIGLAGFFLGLGLAVARGIARRVVAVLVAGAGLAGVAVVATGTLAAAGQEGVVTPGPYAAVAAAAALLVAAAAALRGPVRPPARSRYRVADEHAGDQEWRAASVEPDAEQESGGG